MPQPSDAPLTPEEIAEMERLPGLLQRPHLLQSATGGLLHLAACHPCQAAQAIARLLADRKRLVEAATWYFKMTERHARKYPSHFVDEDAEPTLYEATERLRAALAQTEKPPTRRDRNQGVSTGEPWRERPFPDPGARET